MAISPKSAPSSEMTIKTTYQNTNLSIPIIIQNHNKQKMQPSPNSSFLTQSRYHRKTQKLLHNFLTGSFNYSPELATLLITVHQCSDMAELMSLFVLDDQNKYGHIFVPDVQDVGSARCRVCGENREMHINQITWSELDKFWQQLANNQGNNSMQSSILQEQKLSQFLPSPQPQPQLTEQPLLSPSAYQYKMNHPLPGSQSQTYKTCCICYANYIAQQQMVSIEGAVHEVCLNCMGEYLREEILNLRIQRIKCPHCGVELGPEVVKEYVSNILFEKYKAFSRNLEIQKNPNFKWCPNPKCSVVISINKKSKTAKCPKCDTQICTKCNSIAHTGQSCDQVQHNIYKDLQNAKDIQKCKKCRALVQKIAGCNHMTCGVCKYEWCWLCGSTYSDVHFSPLNPLGCAGMQNRNLSGFAKCKIYFLRVLMIIGFLILLPVVAPCVMVFCGPVLLYNFFVKRMCRSYNCCFHIFMALLSLPLGLIIDPFVWIGAIIYFVPSICRAIGDWFERRRYMNESSQNQIKRRLLQDGEAVVVSES